MGRAQEAGWVAGLVLGAGACYCVYRLAWGEKKSRKSAAEGGSRGCPAEQGRTSPQRGSSPSSPAEDDCTKSSSILDAQHLKKLICLLESTEDPLIRERALITLGNSAAFSVNQDVIRNLDGLLVIGNILKDPNPRVKEKALNALNNLSMNIQNQKEIKIQTLKVLLNLSANPSMTKELLSVQVPSSLISLFDGNTEKEILLRVLTLFANLKNSIKQKENAFAQHQFNKSSLFSFLNGESTECTEKLLSLIYHHDVDVKEKVAEILTLL
ncbi:armadillo repeat-containing protein 10 isoform X2 [Phascolarctos cinereus]|uniref:Armadillo repeat-containing protein 10 isoform X2 n=1 Tax=Phascolarctos cinereus TaxID=38626 RepID=A0A6P5K4L4_PHACI|nr:armadillo repeat-containing protein 10 isoform X2 [Phascolarctos cinereus]